MGRDRGGEKQWVRDLSEETAGAGGEMEKRGVKGKEREIEGEGVERGREGGEEIREPNKREIEKAHPLSSGCLPPLTRGLFSPSD